MVGEEGIAPTRSEEPVLQTGVSLQHITHPYLAVGQTAITVSLTKKFKILVLVQVAGLEPARLLSPNFKFGMYANSIIPAYWRRHSDLNRGIEILQTSALPLGYDAFFGGESEFKSRSLHMDAEGEI